MEIQFSSPMFEQGKMIFTTRSKEDTKEWIYVVTNSIERAINDNGEKLPRQRSLTVLLNDPNNPCHLLK
jgi:dihydrofolate reductase